MRLPTRSKLLACMLAACVLFVLPAAAGAATAPTLVSPAANDKSLTEGGSATFKWQGTLQGDEDAIDRSFFRVEIIAAASMPAGTQAAWPESTLENYAPTKPGDETATSVSLGVPTAGEYRWRVCVWGVVDDMVANEIQQLPGGCSASRAFTTAAADSSSGTIGRLDVEERQQVDGQVTTVYVPSTDTDTGTDDNVPVTPVQPNPPVTTGDTLRPAEYQAAGDDPATGSALALGGGTLAADKASARNKGVAGTVFGALGATLPLVPIPFWSLAMLLACVPILVAWRRNILGMFEWSDGSIDGFGTMPDPLGELAIVPLTSEVKDSSRISDAVAPAPCTVNADHDAPGRGRRAA